MSLICQFQPFELLCPVSAEKIQCVIPNPRGHEVHFVGDKLVPVQVAEGWVLEFEPRPGDWMVFRTGMQPVVVGQEIFKKLFKPASEV